MEQVDPNTHRKSLWATLAVAAVTGVSAVTIVLPTGSAYADPPPPPPPVPGDPNAPAPAHPADPNAPAPAPADPADPNAPAPAPADPADPNAPAPVDPNAPPPPADPADPNAPAPPPADPHAPEPGRLDNAPGGSSFVLPAGWVESDPSSDELGSRRPRGPHRPGSGSRRPRRPQRPGSGRPECPATAGRPRRSQRPRSAARRPQRSGAGPPGQCAGWFQLRAARRLGGIRSGPAELRLGAAEQGDQSRAARTASRGRQRHPDPAGPARPEALRGLGGRQRQGRHQAGLRHG